MSFTFRHGSKQNLTKFMLKIQKRYFAAEATTIQLKNVFKCYDLEELPKSTASLSKKQAIQYYTDMYTIRRMETVCSQLYREKIIRGFCHLYMGQEAVCVGMKAALRPIDDIITAYRCHGWAYLMDIGLIGVMAELTGRRSGCSRGKGGSMHMYAPCFYGGNGIVGAQVSLGNGIAFKQKYMKTGGICVSLYGDGAANQGQIFESYNMACLWKLPILYVCENNNYGMGTKADRAAYDTDFYARAGYIPGLWVDGMNILAVRTATEYAIQYITKGKGPLVLEMYTYRYGGHSMSDPGTSYRTKEEVEDVKKKRDCIDTFKETCIANDLFTEQDVKAIDDKIRKTVYDASKVAKNDKEIELKELTADVYYNNLHPKIRGILYHNLPHIRISKTFKNNNDNPKKTTETAVAAK